MSLKLRRITANNFRKFRSPITIDGPSDGLNIEIEPNETGKSTLLEAIRAAFFYPGQHHPVAQAVKMLAL